MKKVLIYALIFFAIYQFIIKPKKDGKGGGSGDQGSSSGDDKYNPFNYEGKFVIFKDPGGVAYGGRTYFIIEGQKLDWLKAVNNLPELDFMKQEGRTAFEAAVKEVRITLPYKYGEVTPNYTLNV